MKNGIILAKKKTWTSRLDLDYLDENSELKQKNKPKNKSLLPDRNSDNFLIMLLKKPLAKFM